MHEVGMRPVTRMKLEVLLRYGITNIFKSSKMLLITAHEPTSQIECLILYPFL